MNPARSLIATAILGSSVLINAGEAVLYVTEDGQAMSDIAVEINGEKKLVNKAGFVTFDLRKGDKLVTLSQFGEFAGEFTFTLEQDADQAEIQVDILGGEAIPQINVFNTANQIEAGLGQVSGFLESMETGGAVAGARISIADTDFATTTDEEGFYQLELPRGLYDLAIAHPNYGNRNVRNVRVMSNVATGANLTLSLSGDGVIEEVVAIGSYIPSTATAQQRDATGVLEAIGSEQFSKFGDSDAASALKRVTGVTISGGKYAVVRGLNERYTSVLFNGAQLSSPDPTRRVVPLDIFPSSVISTIEVEKTSTAKRPADAAGATINIVTADAGPDPQGKVSLKLGYLTDTTGESSDFQKTTSAEVFGFGSSDRDLSEQAIASSRVVPAPRFTGEEGADLLNIGQLQTEEITIKPDVSISGSYENLLASTNLGDIAYKVDAKYANEWQIRDEQRAVFDPVGDGTIIEADEYEERRVINDIELDLGVGFNLTGDNYAVNSQTLFLKKTTAEYSESVGLRGENRDFTVERNSIWEEREFFVQQLSAESEFDVRFPTTLESGVTYSQSKLDLPDSTSYELKAGGVNNPRDNEFNPRSDDKFDDATVSFITRPSRSFLSLTDESFSINIDFDSLINETDSSSLNVGYGFALTDKERESETYLFNYDVIGQLAEGNGATDIADVITDANFANGSLEVFPNYNPLASYTGEIKNTAFYVSGIYEVFDKYSVTVGVRQEDGTLDIETDSLGNSSPTVANLEDNDTYTSLNTTYYVNENFQVRASYFNSINRPDFREVAPAQFRDASTGDRYIGNPFLTESYIDSIDLRAEYYFSDAESISFAIFRKDFEDAIERTSSIISGSSNTVLYSFSNNGDAFAQGVEFAVIKDFDISGLYFNLNSNIALFDTGIEVSDNSGNFSEERNMQGQPDLLANIGVSVDSADNSRTYNIGLIHTGESLFAVSTNSLLEDQMQSARTVIDLNVKQRIFDDLGTLSLSIKNLTDSEIEQTQNGRVTRAYKTGTKINLGFGYEF